MLVSSAPSVTSPHPPVLFLVRVRYRRGTHITSLYQSSAFSALFYNDSGHCTVVILVCIFRAKCPPSPAMQRRSKSAETLTIRCTLHLNSPSSIWGFGAFQEMICIEERTPTVAGDLGLFQSWRRSLLECSDLPGKDQKLSLRRKAVFHRGNEHWQLQSY